MALDRLGLAGKSSGLLSNAELRAMPWLEGWLCLAVVYIAIPSLLVASWPVRQHPLQTCTLFPQTAPPSRFPPPPRRRRTHH